MIIKGSHDTLQLNGVTTFKADLVCEFCGAAETITAYDTEEFHREVLPAHACPICRKASERQTSAPAPAPTTPGYPVITTERYPTLGIKVTYAPEECDGCAALIDDRCTFNQPCTEQSGYHK